jgi:hypothetical protein
MIITTYNVHLKAPFFPVVFVVKQRILCRTGPSLLSNQSFAQQRVGEIRLLENHQVKITSVRARVYSCRSVPQKNNSLLPQAVAQRSGATRKKPRAAKRQKRSPAQRSDQKAPQRIHLNSNIFLTVNN